MKRINTLVLPIIAMMTFSCNQAMEEQKATDYQQLGQQIDQWHQAAADADTLTYFGLMDASSVFIGTDPEERWTLSEFQDYVMPFFREGRGWDFKASNRKFRSLCKNHVLFDESLDTWMGPCFGTGVMERTGEEWKIIHYHLAFTVPNEDIGDVIEMLR